MELNGDSGARSDRFSIKASVFKEMPIPVPISNGEQKQIGDFFNKIDFLIALHQRKLDHLKEQKTGLLQKMFPKKGEVVPEVRFPGFTDAWEQRKVSELLKERTEKAPESEIYPLMAFIANEGVAPKGDRYDRAALVKDVKNKKYKRTKLGDFIRRL